MPTVAKAVSAQNQSYMEPPLPAFMTWLQEAGYSRSETPQYPSPSPLVHFYKYTLNVHTRLAIRPMTTKMHWGTECQQMPSNNTNMLFCKADLCIFQVGRHTVVQSHDSSRANQEILPVMFRKHNMIFNCLGTTVPKPFNNPLMFPVLHPHVTCGQEDFHRTINFLKSQLYCEFS